MSGVPAGIKESILLVLAFLFVGQLYAQNGREVGGVVRDSSGTGIPAASVRLVPLDGSADSMSTRTNADGVFIFKNVRPSGFTLSVSSLGYRPVHIRSLNPEGAASILLTKPIILKADAIALDQVIVKGAAGVVIKQDTIEFSAADFKLQENAVAEDLIRRLDGVEVDRNGNVSAQGKAVTRVRVNGKDFFGGDVKTATKNIPAKAIDKVQIVQDYGDQANFTGVRDQDPETVINITTKPGSRGIIANATVGGGSDDRYQLQGFGNYIEGERNIGITANLNNNGTQIGGFGANRPAGPSAVTMVNASGGVGGFGAGGVPADLGPNNGITTLGSVGLNYNHRWNKKLVVTGGYFFNNNDNHTLSNTISQNSTAIGTITGLGDAERNAHSHAHSMNARFQYTIGPSDMLIVSPSVGFNNNRNEQFRNSIQTGVIRQDQLSTSTNRMYAPSIGGNALYTHRFKKAGRNYSVNAGARTNRVSLDDDNLNNIRYYDPFSSAVERDSIERRNHAVRNQTFLTAFRFIFSEPLSKTGSLQFSYNMNYNQYDNKRVASYAGPAGAFSPVDSLSNIFDYSFASHQAGVNYSYRNQSDEFAVGFTVNPTSLSGRSTGTNTRVSRNNLFLAPILRYTHRYSRTRNIQLNYLSRASEPTFSQLQPVRDLSDPQRQVIGNPDLNSSFSHTLNANYNSSNPDKRSSFLFRLQASLIDNRIVSNTVLIPDLYGSFKREIRYQNADGTYSYSGNYNWQKSFADRQYTIRLNGNAGYNRNVSFADNIKNLAREASIRQGLGLQINPGNWLEFSPTFSYRLSNIDYTLPTNTDVRIHTYSIDVDGSMFFLKNRSLIWRFSGFKNFNSGYWGPLNENPLVVNTSLEKNFLKDRSATLRLQAFDLFDQSNNINRFMMDNGFADVSTNRLTRYFMLTLTMRVNRMPAATAPAGPQRAPGSN
jgi:hypothetical protein